MLMAGRDNKEEANTALAGWLPLLSALELGLVLDEGTRYAGRSGARTAPAVRDLVSEAMSTAHTPEAKAIIRRAILSPLGTGVPSNMTLVQYAKVLRNAAERD